MSDERPRPLTLAERAVLWLVRKADERRLGYPPPFAEELVRASGARGTIAFGKAVGAAMGGLEKRYGAQVSNLIMGMAGLWNGCRYCGIGHIYAVNLLFFKATGRLYPIAESDVPALQEMSYEASLERVVELLSSDELLEHQRIVVRLFALRQGAEIQGEEDRLLSAALASWAWLNECSVPLTYDMQVKDVPAILEKTERERILERYRAAREAAARRAVEGPRSSVRSGKL
jgi:hypothetical protein